MAGKFEPKTPVQLNPPKSDPISKEFLSQCKGAIWFPAAVPPLPERES
jgi:hypothetical protein